MARITTNWTNLLFPGNKAVEAYQRNAETATSRWLNEIQRRQEAEAHAGELKRQIHYLEMAVEAQAETIASLKRQLEYEDAQAKDPNLEDIFPGSVEKVDPQEGLTAEQLDALPVGAMVLTRDNRLYTKSDHPRFPWNGDGSHRMVDERGPIRRVFVHRMGDKP